MTLILTVNGRESIWLLADRRLSYNGQPAKEDGRKLMFLETTDGVSMLGYAGLGATDKGTEPADWMSAVLRGHNLPLEHSLGILADALQRQFPQHLVRLPKQYVPAHHILIPAFVNDELRFYSIDMILARDRKSFTFRYTRHVLGLGDDRPPKTPRLSIGGSGAAYLSRDKSWKRNLLQVVRACDTKKVSPDAVAGHLAALNYQVHLGLTNGTVGPRCIVAWRHRKSGIYGGGGGQKHYTGTSPDLDSPSLPTIVNGMDIQALTNAMMPDLLAQFQHLGSDDPPQPFDVDAINAKLARLPKGPDETLR